MKNKNTKFIIIFLIVLTRFLSVTAQESTTLQFMRGLPQSDLQNPALHNDSSLIVLGLPAFSGMYLDMNSRFAVNDLIHQGTGRLADSLVLDIDRFHRSLGTNNAVQQHSSVPLFYLGLRRNKSFFSLGITEKQVAQLSFDKSLVTFLKEGNASYMGQNFDLGNLRMNAFHYREYALGYSSEFIPNKLSLGVKVKALYGKFAMQTERMNMQIESAADSSALYLRSDMKINLSLPGTLEYDEDGYLSGMNSENLQAGDYLMQKGNFGMAFDLGAVYQLNPKITLSASIVDLGRISFKKDVHTMSKVANYKWEGIDFSNSMDEADADYVDPADLVEEETDKMKDSFLPKAGDLGSEAFAVNIPTKFYLGGTYQINDQINIGVLNRLYKYGSVTKNTLTLSGNAYLGDFFSVSGSYSVVGNTYTNLGLGMAVRLGFAQLYIVSDNLTALADPSKARYVNARFGLNLLFGRIKVPSLE